jgi:hypothetical protein
MMICSSPRSACRITDSPGFLVRDNPLIAITLHGIPDQILHDLVDRDTASAGHVSQARRGVIRHLDPHPRLRRRTRSRGRFIAQVDTVGPIHPSVGVQLDIDQSLDTVISRECCARSERIHPHAAHDMLYPEMQHP